MNESSSTRVRTTGQSLLTAQLIRNAWYVAAWADELGPGSMLARTVLGEPVVMFRKTDSTPVALENRCPHRFAPLSMGKLLDGDRIQCPYHGLEFDAAGSCVLNPHGQQNIPSRARIASFAVVEKHRALWIWMGQGSADPELIPDFSVLDEIPDFCGTKLDSIRIEAGYKLIVDNLLDLSHTSFLHAGTLGNADTVRSTVDVQQEGDDIIVTRFATDAAPPGRSAMQWPGHPERVDVFTRIRWTAPSTLNLLTGVCEIGKPWDTGTGIHALHMLTPETEHSTHYFFTAVRFGLRTTDAAANRAIQEKIAQQRRYAFEIEDAPVIEAQQRNLEGARRRLEPVVLSVDAGAVRFRQVIERMEAKEAATRATDEPA